MAFIVKHASGELERNSTRWAAEFNIKAQEDLFDAICVAQAASENSLDVVAERLGITEDEARDVLKGTVDITLTELRLLLVACETIVEYHVRPATPAHSEWLSRFRKSVRPDAHKPWSSEALVSWRRLASSP